MEEAKIYQQIKVASMLKDKEAGEKCVKMAQ